MIRRSTKRSKMFRASSIYMCSMFDILLNFVPPQYQSLLHISPINETFLDTTTYIWAWIPRVINGEPAPVRCCRHYSHVCLVFNGYMVKRKNRTQGDGFGSNLVWWFQMEHTVRLARNLAINNEAVDMVFIACWTLIRDFRAISQLFFQSFRESKTRVNFSSFLLLPLPAIFCPKVFFDSRAF